MLFRLIYASDSEPSLEAEDLYELVRQATENNRDNEITGMLLYGQGEFLQVLEGERDVVNRLFQKISVDVRHHDVHIIEAKQVANREFGQWLTEVVEWPDELDDRTKEILLATCGEPRLSASRMDGSQVIALFKSLLSHGHLIEG
ncbi:MAG: BLUF domain-containing protein [Pseudomonadota bacterium]|nr:BLUF domain-containing protein [Pseudomonadota bacterium]